MPNGATFSLSVDVSKSTGRQQELSVLGQHFWPLGEIMFARCPVQISGLSGSGKSHLMELFLAVYGECYDHILVIHCNSASELAAMQSVHADDPSFPASLAHESKTCAEDLETIRCLTVFDGASPPYNHRFQSRLHHVIIITRDHAPRMPVPVRQLYLNGLGITHSEQLLDRLSTQL